MNLIKPILFFGGFLFLFNLSRYFTAPARKCADSIQLSRLAPFTHK